MEIKALIDPILNSSISSKSIETENENSENDQYEYSKEKEKKRLIASNRKKLEEKVIPQDTKKQMIGEKKQGEVDGENGGLGFPKLLRSKPRS